MGREVGVLAEVTSSDITRADIEHRVEDWVRRVIGLYQEITRWLPAGWKAECGGSVSMNEAMMREFGVPARDLPVLELRGDHGRKARFEPRGLWIVGTNGRVDLTLGDAHHVIIDRAENFAPPAWHVAPLTNRRALRPLDRTRLADLLR